MTRSFVVRLAGIALLAACRSVGTDYAYPDDLYSDNYIQQSKAVAEFAANKDEAQLPKAFQLLLDTDASVRLVAYEAILALSADGVDFGYEPALPADIREGVVSRWEAWWRKSRAPEASHG